MSEGMVEKMRNGTLRFGVRRNGRMRFDPSPWLETARYRVLDTEHEPMLWSLCGDDRPLRAVRRCVRRMRAASDDLPMAKLWLRIAKRIGRQLRDARA